MSQQIDLVGRWDILSWEQVFDDGRSELPMGEGLHGFIRYTDDGDMDCMIARANRPKFETGGQWNASDAEKARAYTSMLAYAGTYSLDGEVVTHKVSISMFPNWVGSEQRRRIQVNADGTIALTARMEEGTPQARTVRLVWRKAGGRKA
ncbi:lipocalin-like domain-containing protein [Thauera sp. 63]|jgi:hypothetical protein|uniref:lipocalin-like domain-containing protein n=1 Tax=Thauera sp. 63 TaxID=497321 RepID=UPI0002CE9017|nr:lipocalin-like domain-containing protein [Thauera sp. 63]ENO79133.1 hypothetical protein C664_05361 [Thauera sp. 63]